MKNYQIVKSIMDNFSAQTGLIEGGRLSRRYLWTDAFAVCNFLELYHQGKEKHYEQMALLLIDEVHTVLGHYHEKDAKEGWISGLAEKEAKMHPTIGGLRIGKPMPERAFDEKYDDRKEWDCDGQYFHYLTKWMHALNKTAVITNDTKYIRWAVELAKTAHRAFTYLTQNGSKRMVWKMSTDLTRPLVPSMGQHDPFDAFVTYSQLAVTMKSLHVGDIAQNLEKETAEALQMCLHIDFATNDTLGIGGLLSHAYELAQLIVQGYDIKDENIIAASLKAANDGLHVILQNNAFEYSAEYRLAFRELGLAIGLHALERLRVLSKEFPEYFSIFQSQLDQLTQFIPAADAIEIFWQMPDHQQSSTWKEHTDINSVMLATSLAPDGFLTIIKKEKL